MARWQLWESEDGLELTFIPTYNTHAVQLTRSEGAHVVWEVDAVGWNAAMTARNEHLGWEPYKPMLRPDGSCFPEDEVDPVLDPDLPETGQEGPTG